MCKEAALQQNGYCKSGSNRLEKEKKKNLFEQTVSDYLTIPKQKQENLKQFYED